MGAKRKAPEGLDYVPVPGSNPLLVFGVIRSVLAGVAMTALLAVFRRLFPVAKPADPERPWPRPTCYRYDVLLPPGASDDYLDPEVLCRAYAAHGFEGIKDLVVIATVRFPDAEMIPPRLKLHEAWELARSFAYQRLTLERKLAVVIVMHVPRRAGQGDLAPHCHIMALARELGPTGFGNFIRPLASDAGRQLMDQEWTAWCEVRGQ